jgi:Ca2+:H+ antiporter
MHLPDMTPDEFTRAVAVATVSALRQQQAQAHSPVRMRVSGMTNAGESEGGHGGHDAPSWSRFTSASVLLVCTALYAAIAGAKDIQINVVIRLTVTAQKFLSTWLMLSWKAPKSTRSSLGSPFSR